MSTNSASPSPDRRKATIGIVAAALGLASVVGVVSYQRGNRAEPSESDVPSSLSPSEVSSLWGSEADDAVLLRAWKPGQQYVYSLAFDADVSFQGAAEPSMTQRVTGTWEATVLDVDREQNAWLHLALVDAEVRWRGQDDLADEEKLALEAAFLTPVTWRVARSGSIDLIGLDPQMLPAAQQSFKHLSGLTQVVLPMTPATSWTVEEIDSQGKVDATYERRKDGRFGKRRGGYSSVLAGAGDRTVTLESYEATVSWTPSVPFEDVEVKEHVRFDTPDLLPTAHAHSVVALALDTEREVDAATLADLRASVAQYVEVPLYGDVTTDAKRAALDEAWIAGLDLESMLSKLAALDESEADRHTRMRLHMALAALFRQDPRARKQALELVRQKHDESLTLVSALGDSGHADAQRGLLDLASGTDLENEVRGWTAVAITRTGEPPADVLDGLEDLFEDPQLGDQARFGLGSAIGLIRESNPELAEEAIETLIDQLRSAQGHADIVRALLAIGNSGHPAAWEAVRPYLRHKDVRIRQSAVAAIRLMPGDEVEQALSEISVTDGEFEVRREALHAMTTRSPTAKFLPALYVAVKNDPVLQVRQAAVNVAVKPEWKRDAVLPILEYVAQHEQNRSLQQQAEKFVSAG